MDDYYRKKDAKPLIFCHFARGLADRAYDEVPDYASLYKTLMEALNGECWCCRFGRCTRRHEAQQKAHGIVLCNRSI